MLHTVPYTRAGFYPLSFALSVSYFVLSPLWSGSSQPLREGSEEMQTGKKKEKKRLAFLKVSLLPVSLSLVSLAHPPSAWCFAPVSGMS